MKRVVIIGTTGSGKTILAARVADLLQCPHIELDALFWLADWKPVPSEEFRRRVREAISGKIWVADGNYISKARDLIWGRAVTIVWLDYPPSTIMWRLLGRTVRRSVTQEPLWNNSRETLLNQFLTRDSLFLWALKTYPAHRENYPRLFRETTRPDQTIVVLHNQTETDQWIEGIKNQPRC